MLVTVLADAYTRANRQADWREVEGLWHQFANVVAAPSPGPPNYLPPDLTARLARALGHVFASYDEEEDLFVEHALAVASHAERQPDRDQRHAFLDLYHDKRLVPYTSYGGERRLPRPFEAAVETSRRLRDLGRIRDQLTVNDLCACVLGGSTSYGRFHNTVGAKENSSSDLDLLLVRAANKTARDVLEALRRVPGMSGLESAMKRASMMSENGEQPDSKDHPIFSHKLRMWGHSNDPLLEPYSLPGEYQVSIHSVSLEQFRWLTLHDVPRIEEPLDRKVWDFRDTEPKRDDSMRSFAGTEVTVERPVEAVEGGWLAQSVVSRVIEGRFAPGLHQNLILPRFDLRWEMRRHRLGLSLFAFRWKVVERLRQERRLRPYETQLISLSHTRAQHFAPQIRQRVDADLKD